MLEIKSLAAAYGPTQVLHGVDVTVNSGEIVALIGANGAGKTTLMRCISGLVPSQAGSIRFCGDEIQRVRAHKRTAMGLVQSPEGRQIFTDLTVEDNLRLGAFTQPRSQTQGKLEEVLELFPILRERIYQLAGKLSGGQQQMLAIGRALMGRPKCLLLDEPSMGLAPIIVSQVMEIVSGLRERGISIFLVEQNAAAALGIADRAYVMATGKIVLSGQARDLLHDAKVRKAFLGL